MKLSRREFLKFTGATAGGLMLPSGISQAALAAGSEDANRDGLATTVTGPEARRSRQATALHVRRAVAFGRSGARPKEEGQPISMTPGAVAGPPSSVSVKLPLM